MKEIIKKINSAKTIAVLGHLNADPDAIGSCYAFAQMMRKIGKQAVVYLNETIEDRLAFMGDDYLVYDGANADEFDLCMCLDCGDMERLGKRSEIFEAAKSTASIDHHRTNTYFAEVNYVDAGASATGEILCRLFREMDLPLDNEIAKQLYTAISSDTGSFKFSNVTSATMREAASLLDYEFDHAEIVRLLYDSKTFNEIKFSAEVMLSMKSYEDGKITVVSIDRDMLSRNGIAEDQAPNVVDIPRSVRGTEIAVSLRDKGDEIRINLRSNEYADVSKIAVRLGGGGHIRAAGCGIRGKTLEEAETILVKLCKEVL